MGLCADKRSPLPVEPPSLQAGIAVQLKQMDQPGPALPCQIPQPSWFGAMFQRALSMVSLRHGEAGGFRAWVTASSAGG